MNKIFLIKVQYDYDCSDILGYALTKESADLIVDRYKSYKIKFKALKEEINKKIFEWEDKNPFPNSMSKPFKYVFENKFQEYKYNKEYAEYIAAYEDNLRKISLYADIRSEYIKSLFIEFLSISEQEINVLSKKFNIESIFDTESLFSIDEINEINI